jgi:hypothetical protein
MELDGRAATQALARLVCCPNGRRDTILAMDTSSIEKELREQRELIEKIYVSAEKTRKYFLWTMWGTVIVFVVPLIALAFVVPYFMNTYVSQLSGATSGLGL